MAPIGCPEMMAVINPYEALMVTRAITLTMPVIGLSAGLEY